MVATIGYQWLHARRWKEQTRWVWSFALWYLVFWFVCLSQSSSPHYCCRKRHRRRSSKNDGIESAHTWAAVEPHCKRLQVCSFSHMCYNKFDSWLFFPSASVLMRVPLSVPPLKHQVCTSMLYNINIVCWLFDVSFLTNQKVSWLTGTSSTFHLWVSLDQSSMAQVDSMRRLHLATN